MTETTTPTFLRQYTPEQIHAALRGQVESLRAELASEMYARAKAEAEADFGRELVVELERRLATAEAVNERLLRFLGSRLLRAAGPVVVTALAGGFAAVALLRLAGF